MFKQAVWDEPLLIEMSRRGRRGYNAPSNEKARASVGDGFTLIPSGMRRRQVPLPSLSEPQIVRHFTRLSQMNFGVDCVPYPLGSCTMKYNPKLPERLARHPGLTRLHPYQPQESAQGVLEILHRLSRMLAEITGIDAVSLAPAAGAHGELVGALIMKACVQERGEGGRREMLVPDSAHGTNPASASMAGFQVVKIPTDERGRVDLKAVKAVASERTAGMMMTVPNTLGLFEDHVLEIADAVHGAGGLMYYDGANMNALLGRVRPGDMGFDIVHMNLHKTFGTPHGGGGPGSGPVGVVSGLRDYLPAPLIGFDGKNYFLDYDVSKTIGAVKAFYGNVSVLVRAYAYILLMGRDGLTRVSEQSILASNYVLRQLVADAYATPFEEDAPRKHEFVVSCAPLKRRTGVGAIDVAKSLLDRGIYAPTVHFPLVVDEALMLEPTETEPLESLDLYVSALNRVAEAASQDPGSVLRAPQNTSVSRLDEVRASHPLTMAYNWRGVKPVGEA